jgi:hypothetical protein
MVDIALLKSRMRSRKDKHLHPESTGEYALDHPSRKLVESEKEQKLKVVSKGLSQTRL